MKIKVSVSMMLVGCRKEVTVEVDDDMTDDEIEEFAREVLFGRLIEWNWSKLS